MLLGCLFIVISLLLMIDGYDQIRYGFQSPAWPITEGKVLKSDVVEIIDTELDESCWPEIYYSYLVDNIPYTGTRLYFIQSGVGVEWATLKIQ